MNQILIKKLQFFNQKLDDAIFFANPYADSIVAARMVKKTGNTLWGLRKKPSIKRSPTTGKHADPIVAYAKVKAS